VYCVCTISAEMLVFTFVLYSVCGPLEADPEYQLIVEANNVTVEIDNEISKFYDVRYTFYITFVSFHM